MVKECNTTECQKKGSQMTAIASLMGLIYGCVGLNSLFMFIGAFRANWRVCSVYCTMCVCFLTLILLIVVATMLFTPYNAICSRSMYPSWGEAMPFYMFDDFYWTYTFWISSWILMFVFLCIGMCQNFSRKM